MKNEKAVPDDLERIVTNRMRKEICYAGDTPPVVLVYASKSTGRIYYADTPPDWAVLKMEQLKRHLIEYTGKLTKEELIRISDRVKYEAMLHILR